MRPAEGTRAQMLCDATVLQTRSPLTPGQGSPIPASVNRSDSWKLFKLAVCMRGAGRKVPAAVSTGLCDLKRFPDPRTVFAIGAP